MPARSTRIYIIKRNAPQMGLSFAMPSWWDVERLFEMNDHRRVILPDGREVLLLDWTTILDYDLKADKKTWNLPERGVNVSGTVQHRADLLKTVQIAEWFIVEREQVWLVPEHSQPGCDIWNKPSWWGFAFGVPDFRAWYEKFRQTHRIDERYFEIPNPLWLDYVSLLTGPEARMLDERAREAFGVWKKSYGQKRLTTYERQQIDRFARALQQAEWVVLYEYEWESGLA